MKQKRRLFHKMKQIEIYWLHLSLHADTFIL